LQHQSAWPSPGVKNAVARQCQAENLAVLAGKDDADLALGGYLVDLAFIAGGREQIAVFILNDVPYVGRFQGSQRFESAREAQGAFAADHGMFEARLFELGRGAVMPDFDLGRLTDVRKHQQNQCRGGHEIATHERVPHNSKKVMKELPIEN
jgi:hypothetical protein